MAKKKGGSISNSEGEPKVQSKVNPALSYGRRTGDTYINKPEKPKKKTPKTPGGYVRKQSLPYSITGQKKNGAR